MLWAKLVVASPVVLSPGQHQRACIILRAKGLPGNNVQLRKDAIERSAGPASERQHDPVVALGPSHHVGFSASGLWSLALEQRMLLARTGVGWRFSPLCNDAGFRCSSMTCGAGARTGVWLFPGWAALTKHSVSRQG